VKKMRIPIAALVLAALIGLAGCGVKKEKTGVPSPARFDVVLDFFPNADHVGIYAGIADGAFRREGLDVRPRTPADPAEPLKLVAAGQADLAISYEPELLLARDRGLQLVSVGAIVQRPLTSIIALGDKKIHSVADLKGKRVGTAGIPYQSAYLKTILQRANIDPATVRETSVGFNLVPAMLAGKVDATLGGFWNYEGVQLSLQKKKPTVIRVDQAGVPTYDELVLVARRAELRKHGSEIRRFMRALARGYESARANPQRAVDALVKASPGLDRKLQLASVQATLPAFFPPGSRPFGFQESRLWVAYGDWMLRNQLVKRPPNAGAALTNEFLPGQGV
jgi:putative hydroxymethylpyrimidine transport system substrate-binding protein